MQMLLDKHAAFYKVWKWCLLPHFTAVKMSQLNYKPNLTLGFFSTLRRVIHLVCPSSMNGVYKANWTWDNPLIITALPIPYRSCWSLVSSATLNKNLGPVIWKWGGRVLTGRYSFWPCSMKLLIVLDRAKQTYMSNLFFIITTLFSQMTTTLGQRAWTPDDQSTFS